MSFPLSLISGRRDVVSLIMVNAHAEVIAILCTCTRFLTRSSVVSLVTAVDHPLLLVEGAEVDVITLVQVLVVVVLRMNAVLINDPVLLLPIVITSVVSLILEVKEEEAGAHQSVMMTDMPQIDIMRSNREAMKTVAMKTAVVTKIVVMMTVMLIVLLVPLLLLAQSLLLHAVGSDLVPLTLPTPSNRVGFQPH